MSLENSNVEDSLSVEAIKRRLELQAIPVDFDQLCKDGILERLSKRKFKVLDVRRLPEYVKVRACAFGGGCIEFEDTVKHSQKLLSKIEKQNTPKKEKHNE